MNDILQYIKPCNIDMDYIFVSYSGKDSEYVWTDVLELQRRGYNVWLDEKNIDKTKESWKDDALKAIEDVNCQLLLFYVSQHSLCSEACYNEVMHTNAEQTKEIHFGSVKVIVVEVEAMDDLVSYCNNIHKRLRQNEMEKKEKMSRIQTLHHFLYNFFQGNNERIRVHCRSGKTDINTYFFNLRSSFPEEIQLGIIEKAYSEYSKNDKEYRVFISYAHSKAEKEQKIAVELYMQLRQKKIPVFCSFMPVIGSGADQYKELIDRALEKSSILVVIGTTVDSISTSWVQYIWDSYGTDIFSGKREGKVFTYIDIRYKEKLPEVLKYSEIVDQKNVSISALANLINDAITGSTDSNFLCRDIETAQTLNVSRQNTEKTDSVSRLLKFANLVSCGDSSGDYVNPYISAEMADIIAKHIGRIERYNAEKCMEKGLNPVPYEVFLAQKIARINKPENCFKAYQLLHNVINSWTVFLNEENRIVSYWIFIALKEESYYAVSSGKVDEKDISINDVRFIDMPGNYKGYLLLSGTIEHWRTPKVVNTLYDSWLKYLENLAEQGIFFDEIASMVGSIAGNSSLQNIGMKYYADYISGGRMYRYNLTEIRSISFLKRNYPILCELYENEYRR